MTVPELIASIRPADGAARAAARRRWDSIAKPLGSLGLLEEAVEPEGIAPHPQTSQCSIMPITSRLKRDTISTTAYRAFLQIKALKHTLWINPFHENTHG